MLLCLWIKSDPITRVCPRWYHSSSQNMAGCCHIFLVICYVLASTSWYFIYIIFTYPWLWFYVLNHFMFDGLLKFISNSLQNEMRLIIIPSFYIYIKRVITGLQHSFHWIYLSTKLLWFAWISSQLFNGVCVYGLKW